MFKVITGHINQSFNITKFEQMSMPNGDIVFISQTPYCPLFITPMNLILGKDTSTMSIDEKHSAENNIISLLEELNFYNKLNFRKTDIAQELWTEQLNWYAELSGGQISKVELTKLFLRPKCPDLLLLDETFGPLDHKSKKILQNKIKKFCVNSIVMVIYHTCLLYTSPSPRDA